MAPTCPVMLLAAVNSAARLTYVSSILTSENAALNVVLRGARGRRGQFSAGQAGKFAYAEVPLPNVTLSGSWSRKLSTMAVIAFVSCVCTSSST